MSRFAKLFAANAIAAAGLCSAAVALSSVAAAEPALPPVIPDVPALGMIQQLSFQLVQQKLCHKYQKLKVRSITEPANKFIAFHTACAPH